jgi:hypothetical protein
MELDARGRRLHAVLVSAWRHTGIVVVAMLAGLGACATPVMAPTPPKIKATVPSLEGLTKLDLVTDFTKRIDVPGASVLPPHGRIKRWVIGHWRQENADGVVFGAQLSSDRVLIASLVSAPVTNQEWNVLRASGPALFQETVRLSFIEGLVPPWQMRKLDVYPQGKTDGTCARYAVEIDHMHQGSSAISRPGLLLASGRVCVHPESARAIILLAGQSIPPGGVVWDSIEVEMTPFLDSLQFRPLGLAWAQ